MKITADHCPLCGGVNDCQLCTGAVCQGPCWCAMVKVPEELIAQIPSERRSQACLCRNCVMEFHRAEEGGGAGPKIRSSDFYFDNGLMVFTADYHSRRGYCCDNSCRHCPYRNPTPESRLAPAPIG